MKRLRHLVGSFALAATAGGCASHVGAAASVLPNAGVELLAGGPLREDGSLEWELNFTHQFLDDEALSDDGNPAAGDWVQAGASLRTFGPMSERTRWVARGGVQWFDARGAPNLVDAPGDYFGLRLGLGFETTLSPGWTLGPELAILPAYGGDANELRLVPQLTWGLRWSPPSWR